MSTTISAGLVLLVLLALGSQFVRWYLGINRIVAVLESIDDSLMCLPAVRAARGLDRVNRRAS